MNFQYNCPKCKKTLIQIENKLYCNNCSHDYLQENNYINFENNNFSHISENNSLTKKLVLEIKQNGYEQGIEKFLVSNNELKSPV